MSCVLWIHKLLLREKSNPFLRVFFQKFCGVEIEYLHYMYELFWEKNLSNESRRAFFQIGHFPITVCTSVAFLFFPPCYNKHFFIFHEYFSRSSNFFTAFYSADWCNIFHLLLFKWNVCVEFRSTCLQMNIKVLDLKEESLEILLHRISK